MSGNSAQSLVDRYLLMRRTQRAIHGRAVGFLSGDALKEAGRALGLVDKNTFNYSEEEAMGIHCDHCLYDLRAAGRTAMDRFFAMVKPEPGMPEEEVMRATSSAFFSIWIVAGTEPGAQIVVLRDPLRGSPERRVVDRGLSQTARPGIVLGGRLVDFDGFSTTTGAMVQLRKASLERIHRELSAWMRANPKVDLTRLDHGGAKRLAEVVLRAGLAERDLPMTADAE